MTFLIDCHALIASTDLARYPLAADAAPLEPGELEGFLSPAGLARALDGGALRGAVLVQRGRLHGFDNRLVAQTAAADPRLRALCTVDTDAADCAATAAGLLASPGVAGLRFMEPRKGADLGWLAGEGARSLWRLLAERGGIADVHVFPWNRAAGLEALAALAAEFAEVPVLLDNIGGAAVEQGAPDFGVDAALARLAERPGVIFKFSEMTLGRLDRAGINPPAAIARYAAIAGAGRLCWGSDVLPAGMVPEQAAANAVAAAEGLDAAGWQAVLGGAAARLFGFD
ncbi:amidohydrolase family protein [Sphingomonas canadensis]|uniref:Amidohydrolase family protein n=1 Tax=Sphingomonas canadensis TaxID=1219257 RepID=A0ABW3HGE9_9SPHN|nr:amidohydrolase [Sphingomonas canadensis]MCW3838307.1 amidohydrolase [Sphingomonas canadensis]